MARVIIADDEFLSLMLFRRMVEDAGHMVVAEAHNSEETVASVKELKPDLVLLDMAMEGRTSGVQTCKDIKGFCPETRVVFVSGYTQDDFKDLLESLEYEGFIEKPLRKQNLITALQQIGL